jgi:hypothetical protein
MHPEYKNGGQPPVVNDEILDKLETAFKAGATDKEACAFVEISPKALYNYQNRNPEYVQRKEVLKEYTSLRARIAVSNAVSKDIDTAKWYLERKKKGEFTPNPELGLQTNILVLNDDKQSQITESVRNWAETE